MVKLLNEEKRRVLIADEARPQRRDCASHRAGLRGKGATRRLKEEGNGPEWGMDKRPFFGANDKP